MFENKTFNGIYATRFIASWIREGGRFGKRGEGIKDFREWMESIGVEEEFINHTVFIATNGKLELESSAKRWLNEHKES